MNTMKTAPETSYRSLKRLVGNTPLLGIRIRYHGRERVIYAKSEQYNLTGSIKDRMALHILEEAIADGSLKPGATIVEATSGNTGIAFAALGRALRHPVTILMPDWMSRERVAIIQGLGAKVIPVTREQGGFVGSIRMSEEMAANDRNIFLPKQFANAANARAHELTTGPEIWSQLELNGLRPDAFVAGVGTGGTVMGVGRYLRSRNPAIKVHPLEPAESPTLTTGHKVGQHRIQGISDEFIPAILKLGELDSVIAVSDGDAIRMAQQLAERLGLAVGISSGANFLGAVKAQEALSASLKEAVVVTIFSDCNKKYLSTDLLREEPIRDGHMTSEIELLDFTVFRRVCETCCDMDDCARKNGGCNQARAQ